MASIVMTRVQSARSAIFLLLAITLVGVQGRLNPDIYPRSFRGNPFPETTNRFESQPTNLDQSSQFWAFSQNAQDAAGRSQQLHGGVTNEYNYAKEDTNKPTDEFFTPEMLARIKAFNDVEQAKFDRNMQKFQTPEAYLARVKAFNEAQQANLDREMQNYEAKRPVKTTTTSGNSEYPKVLPDGTELLWVTEPQKTSPEEIARLEAMMGKPKSTAALPGSQRNDVQGSTDVPVFNVDSSNWEDGPFGTKHRPGAEHDLLDIAFQQPDGSTTLPQASFNNP